MKPSSRFRQGMLQIAQAVLGVYHALMLPVLAVGLLCGTLVLLGWADALHALTSLHWLLLAPLLYALVLVLMFIIGAVELQLLYLAGYRKPRRARNTESWRTYFQLLVTLAFYSRATLLWGLPLTCSFQVVPLLQRLVFLSYARRVRVGPESIVFGYLYDPDLTHIGSHVMIGARSTISCHSVTTVEGGFAYASAPVHIGDRAVVGGEARISLGVTVGADALVEPGSMVPPFTQIGPGEVWGGNPAVFLRKRSAEGEKEAAAPLGGPVEAVRQALAAALEIPASSVTEALSMASCASWDSLGQMAIAAALHARFGLRLPADDVFRLRTFEDVLRHAQGARQAAIPGGPALPGNAELLPLLDRQQATQALAASMLPARGQAITVVVAATFTAEPLAQALRLWCRAFGLEASVQFAEYNQVQQALLGDDSLFRRNPTGLNVVLARPEDLLDGAGAAEQLLDAVAQFAAAPTGSLIVATMPPPVSRLVPVDRAAAEALRSAWRERLGSLGVEQLEFAAIVEEMGIAAAGQTDLEVVARAPYSQRIYQELGIALARCVRRARIAPAKVIALDADGLLWGGVLAEDGMEEIQLGPDHPGRSYQLFQQQLLRLKERGVLLVLVSRNAEEDVWEVFDRHPGMVLGRDDITAYRINWQAKSQNLREIAAELGLGLDAFVFLDDDPGNRLEVEAHASQVTVVPLPSDPMLHGQTLAQLWCFDAAATTREDRARGRMMRQARERHQAWTAGADLHHYLQSLELRAFLGEASERDLPRVAQLTQKTNQFNLSLRRRTVAELKALGPDATIYAVEASDRFGDYGLIGVAILVRDRDRPDTLELDTFLMSCRALGRGIEDATLHDLLALVRAGGGQRLLAPFVAGPRNQPVVAFLQRAGFRREQANLWSVEVKTAVRLPAHLAWHSSLALVQSRSAS